MFDRATPAARRVLRRVCDEARHVNVSNLSDLGGVLLFAPAELLLLALARETSGVAHRLLRETGVDLAELCRDLETFIKSPAFRSDMGDEQHPRVNSTMSISLVLGGKPLHTPCLLQGVLLAEAPEMAKILAQVAQQTGIAYPQGENHALAALRRAGADVAALRAVVETADATAEGATEPLQPVLGSDRLLDVLRNGTTGERQQALEQMQMDFPRGAPELHLPQPRPRGPLVAAAVPVLMDTLRSPEDKLRLLAARVLGEFGPAAHPAVPALLAALDDQSSIATAAAEALLKIGAISALPGDKVKTLLQGPCGVRLAIALWHATHQVQGVLPTLRAGLANPNIHVRGEAVLYLREIGPDAAPVLAELERIAAGDTEKFIRDTARQAVAAITRQVPAEMSQRLSALNLSGAQFVDLRDQRTEGELLKALDHSQTEERLRAVVALARRSPDTINAALPRLFALLNDTNRFVRIAAAIALGQAGSTEPALNALLDLLKETDPEVTAGAARALAQLGAAATPAVRQLHDLLQHAASATQVAAAIALWEITGQPEGVLPVLTGALESPLFFTRAEVLGVLGAMGTAARPAVPALLAAYGRGGRTERINLAMTLSLIDPSINPDEAAAPPPEPQLTPLAWEIADWTEALRHNTSDVQALRCRGQAREKQGNETGALADYTAALTIAPDDLRTRQLRGAALCCAGDLAGGLADMDFAIRCQPRDADLLNKRAIARKRAGDLEGALADYTAALAATPDRSRLYVNRSILHWARQDRGAAIADLEEALRLDPEDAGACNNLAWYRSTCPDAHFRNGPQAVTFAEKAVALMGRSRVDLLSTLAAAYAEAGRFPDALAVVEEILSRSNSLTAEQLKYFQACRRLLAEGQPIRENTPVQPENR